MSRAKCIMVQGTMSGAGKSVLCAGLCRIFRQDGYTVAPFKSQNMALNSYVTADGLEMGRAQVMQAAAAGLEPDVRMNPVLLKPSSDTGSQVIVNGEIRGQMTAREYFRYKRQLLPEILAAYDSLASQYDIVVIEGAGSPAEINLRAEDIVNMPCRAGERTGAAGGGHRPGRRVRPAVRDSGIAAAGGAAADQGPSHQQVPGRPGDSAAGPAGA